MGLLALLRPFPFAVIFERTPGPPPFSSTNSSLHEFIEKTWLRLRRTRLSERYLRPFPFAEVTLIWVYGPVPPDAVIEPWKISLFDAALLPIPGRPASFASAALSVTSMAADGGTVGSTNAAVGNGAGIVSWNTSVGSSSGGSSASLMFGGRPSTDGSLNSAPNSSGPRSKPAVRSGPS